MENFYVFLWGAFVKLRKRLSAESFSEELVLLGYGGTNYILVEGRMGHAMAQLVEALRYKAEGRGFDSRWCHGILLWHNPSLALGFTRGVKTAGVWGWQPYHLHVPIVTKFGSLNLLEQSGYVQVCNGVAWRALVCHLADPALIPGWSVWHLLRRTWHFHIFYHSNLVSVSYSTNYPFSSIHLSRRLHYRTNRQPR